MNDERIYFGRIDKTWPDKIRRDLMQETPLRFVVMFDPDGSLDHDKLEEAWAAKRRKDKEWFRCAGYTTPQALHTLRRMQEAAGCWCIIDFSGPGVEGNEDAVLGRIGPRLEPHEVSGLWYRSVRLLEARWIHLDPVLKALRPRQATFTQWPAARQRVLALAREEQNMPRNVESLTPGQLEALCFDWLRREEQEIKLLMPIGRGLPAIDIYALAPDGCRIAAQVTHTGTKSAAAVRKCKALIEAIPEGRLVYFGGRDTGEAIARCAAEKKRDVRFCAVEKVFNDSLKKAPDLVEAMLALGR